MTKETCALPYLRGAHSLADFVKYSKGFAIIPEDLPDDIEPDEAVEILEQYTEIMLQPLKEGDNYFYGWFEPEGRKIETVDGTHLFTLTVLSLEQLDGIGFSLKFEEAARELLS